MGNLEGHITYGTAFILLGLWHLINHVKLHIRNPNSFTSHTWFPTSKFRYSELLFILFCSSAAMLIELYIGLYHQPLNPDGSIPDSHLHNFEHSIIGLGFLIYALFAILLDKFGPPAHYGFTNMIASLAFALELLIFHLHASDHMGVEGQCHWLLQILIFTSMATTLFSINYPESFLIAFVRSLCILFQGVWFVNIGFMLWIPGLVPKGCFMNWEDGYFIVRCHGEGALERAKSLVNIQFSYYAVGLTSFAVTLYLVMFKLYSDQIQYQSVARFDGMEEEIQDGVASLNKICTSRGEGKVAFVGNGKSYAPMDLEM